MGAVLNLVVYFIIAALVLMVVSRLNLGLTVSGFVPALIAAVVIAIVSLIVLWLLSLLGISLGGGLLGAILGIIVAAVVLMLSDRFVPGMQVKGFTGALIAAIAIGVIYWILALLIPQLSSPLLGV